jgi:hypothetical protein
MRNKSPQAEVRLTNSGQQALTKLWNAVGSFGFLSAVAVVAGMASEKVAPDTFRLTDLDSHSITLFAIPLLALVLIAEAIVGIAYVRACKPNDSWSNKVPPIVEGLSESGLRPLVSGIVLFAFLVVPWFGLGATVVKFFHGSYYYAKTASNGCDPKDMLKDCERMGAGLKHFCPGGHGIGSLTNTPYRYEGNKTYIPVIFPSVYLLLFAVACFFGFRNCLSLFRKRLWASP